jgi:hypothetical protein
MSGEDEDDGYEDDDDDDDDDGQITKEDAGNGGAQPVRTRLEMRPATQAEREFMLKMKMTSVKTTTMMRTNRMRKMMDGQSRRMQERVILQLGLVISWYSLSSPLFFVLWFEYVRN